jgi:hypothetical protein
MTTDRLAGLALVLFGLVAVWQSLVFPLGSLQRPGPAFAPIVLALLLILFGVLVAATGGGARRIADVGWHDGRHAAAVFGACAFAAWGLERLGYRLTIAIVLAVLLRALERQGWIASLALTVGMAWGSFYVFSTLLRIPLPRGPLGF